MEGRIVESPFGTYVVHRADERGVILHSLERAGAAIVTSSLGPLFVITDRFAPNRAQGNLPRASAESSQVSGDACSWVDRTPGPGVTNGGERAVTGGRDPVVSRDPDRVESAIPPAATSSERPYDPDPSVYSDSLTLGGMRPGSVRMVVDGTEHRRTPCLTRAEGSIWEHCWFLGPGGESLYCHECRARRPMVVMGPIAAIDAIRDAMAAGDMPRAYELVRRMRDRSILPQRESEHAPVAAEVSAPVPCGASHDGRPLKTTSPAGAEADLFEQPVVVCPYCKREHEDFDGFGVVACICGFCKHLSRDGEVCNYCGHRPARDLAEWHELFNERFAVARFTGGLSDHDASDLARMLVGPPPGSKLAA